MVSRPRVWIRQGLGPCTLIFVASFLLSAAQEFSTRRQRERTSHVISDVQWDGAKAAYQFTPTQRGFLSRRTRPLSFVSLQQNTFLSMVRLMDSGSRARVCVCLCVCWGSTRMVSFMACSWEGAIARWIFSVDPRQGSESCRLWHRLFWCQASVRPITVPPYPPPPCPPPYPAPSCPLLQQVARTKRACSMNRRTAPNMNASERDSQIVS